MSQQDMATALRIPFHTYKQYENRSPLPHMHLERFCLLTGVSLWYLVTGQPESVQPKARFVPLSAANS